MSIAEIREGRYQDVLKEVQAHLIFTSPPYNIGSKQPRQDGKRNDELRQYFPGLEPAYDKKSYGAIRDYPDDLDEAEYQRQQAEFLVWAAGHLTANGTLVYNHKPRRRNKQMIHPAKWFLQSEVEKHLILMEEIIWDRGSTHNHDKTQMWAQTERLYVFRKLQGLYPLCNRKLSPNPQKSDVWRIGRAPANGHNAPFPLELAEAVVLAWSQPGDLVCDPYAGSGTTGVAARNHAREFIGAEILPNYAALAKNQIALVGRKCACGCGKPLSPSTGGRPRRWATEACRLRYYRIVRKAPRQLRLSVHPEEAA